MAKRVNHLFKMTGPDGERVLTAREGTTSIGRQEDNDWPLTHEHVSRRHAALERTGAVCRIMDVGSANGTYVNDIKLPPNVAHELQAGDKVRMGEYTFVYEPQEVEEVEAETPEADALEVAVLMPAFHEQPALTAEPPPPIQPLGPLTATNGSRPELPPGLSYEFSRYLDYLPGIYHQNPFMAHFLFLNPRTAPESFLPWFADLYALTFDDTWSQTQQRTLLTEAVDLFDARGTNRSLSRLLEIYLGRTVQIDDQDENLEPFTFTITLPFKKNQLDVSHLERLVDAHKPAHTTYRFLYR
jgi:phage tail P2-like protein